MIKKGIENNLTRIGNGSVPWYPKLKKVVSIIKYWKMLLKQVQGVRVSVKSFFKLVKSLPPFDWNIKKAIAEVWWRHIDCTSGWRRQQARVGMSAYEGKKWCWKGKRESRHLDIYNTSLE